MSERVAIILGTIIGFALLVLVIASLLAIPTMLLVNYMFSDAALVAVFGGPIGFWKAFWLNFLCGILFKSSPSQRHRAISNQ